MPPVSVTFVGNCQSDALASFYREFCVTDAEADVAYIDIVLLDENSPDRPRSLRRLRNTQILVQQIFDWPRPLDDHIPATCERFAFPTATLWFLWPHTGIPHPRNREAPRQAGIDPPYMAEYGNVFLNRLIDAGTPAAEAVRRYLDLDIVARTGTASRLEKELDLYDRRDAQTRIGLRDTIESDFRNQPLFRTRGHPNLKIFTYVANALFRRMGADPLRIASGLRSLRDSPLPPTELPIHPKIAEYFGLSYAGPDTLYRFAQEGRFTFAEYADRYMRFTYNAPLRQLRASRDRPPEQRLAIADQALAISPGSAFILRQRAKLLARLGQPNAALDAAREACAAEPADPGPFFELAVLLHQQHDPGASRQAALTALARHPYHAGALKMLGRLALDANQFTQAADHLRAATIYGPRDNESWALYAAVLDRLGATTEAVAARRHERQATDREPPDDRS